MNFRNRLKAAALALTLINVTGCTTAPSVDPYNQDQIEANISVRHDQFKGQTWVTGPKTTIGHMFKNHSWFLRGLKRGGRPILTQVYFSIRYSAYEWRFYQGAAANGTLFEVTKIAQRVSACSGGSCTYTEDLGIAVNIEQLESMLNENGMVLIGVSDRYGNNIVINFTKAHLAAFKNKFNSAD